ncbi:uncharacterized protein TRIADDRAFT_53781 [Trichoplax adhaerens]|uniref:Uncharacterized protein n=1 Tax=Trichoplax adhaerens TaxID=10228 RepID=B3RQ54_TRIAD|nr:hypothetical protein TRIADDRAFT_53781 [Trichoplax adhaerens]EDV27761.1 hypothetical protein TRIADDRAFT_53781 [Trichoplax adhaerens]|eukprot:XP_002109595.1 hypothetical protein TRIADDRAFT_53781 [Trichoplax adhaerens]
MNSSRNNNSADLEDGIVASRVNLYRNRPKKKINKTSCRGKKHQIIKKCNTTPKIITSNVDSKSLRSKTAPAKVKIQPKSSIKVNSKIDSYNLNCNVNSSNAQISPRTRTPNITAKSTIDCYNPNRISISKGVKINFGKKIITGDVSVRVDCHKMDYRPPRTDIKLSPRKERMDLSKVKSLVDCHNKVPQSTLECKAKISKIRTKINLESVCSKIDNYNDKSLTLSSRKAKVISNKSRPNEVQSSRIDCRNSSYNHSASSVQILNEPSVKVEAHSRLPMDYAVTKNHSKDHVTIFQNSVDFNPVTAKVDSCNYNFNNSANSKEKVIVYHRSNDIDIDDIGPAIDCHNRSFANSTKEDTSTLVYDSPLDISKANTSKIDHHNITYHPKESYANIKQDAICYHVDAIVSSINHSYRHNENNDISVVSSTANFNEIKSKIDHENKNLNQDKKDLARIKSSLISYKDIPAKVSNINPSYILSSSNVNICNSKVECDQVVPKIDCHLTQYPTRCNISSIISDKLDYSNIPGKVDHSNIKCRKTKTRAEIVQVQENRQYYTRPEMNKRRYNRHYDSVKYTSTSDVDTLTKYHDPTNVQFVSRGKKAISSTYQANILTCPNDHYSNVKPKVDCFNFISDNYHRKQYDSARYTTMVEVL